MPIVGVGFSASTDPQRGVGTMTLACNGSGCSGPRVAVRRSLFRNSAGTAGVASIPRRRLRRRLASLPTSARRVAFRWWPPTWALRRSASLPAGTGFRAPPPRVT
jgi:hypothetical protein